MGRDGRAAERVPAAFRRKMTFEWLEEAFNDAVDNIIVGCAERPESEEGIRKREFQKLRSELVKELGSMLNRIKKGTLDTIEREREVVA
jgi:hypothetical protein